MLYSKKFPEAAAQFMSFANVPPIVDCNFNVVANPPAAKTIEAPKIPSARPVILKPEKVPDPIRSAKSTLAWNIIYADKVANGWRPKKITPRFKAFLSYQKAKAMTLKAEVELNKAKSNQNSTIDCAYLVASKLKSVQKKRGYPFVEKVTHRVDENHFGLFPIQWLDKSLWTKHKVKAIFKRVVRHTPETFGKSLRVAIVTASTDLRATGYRVPCGVSPFDVRCLGH